VVRFGFAFTWSLNSGRGGLSDVVAEVAGLSTKHVLDVFGEVGAAAVEDLRPADPIGRLLGRCYRGFTAVRSRPEAAADLAAHRPSP
jgi:hypothetical protein